MKKVSLLLVALVVFFAGNAQLRAGARGGLNIASIVGKDVDGYKAKAGFYIGAQVQVPVVARISIQPELSYSLQGGKWDDEDGGKTDLGYFQLPVLVKFTTASGFFAETGPQPGFLMNAKDKYDGEKEDVKEYLKKTDFSWVFGIGYQFTDHIGVHARYNAGLTKFYEEEKNSVFQVGIHYMCDRLFR